MLEAFVYMRHHVPEAFYNALLKENMPLSDIMKLSVAINEL